MGCFNSKVAPFPPTFRTKKQQKRLKEILNKHGIKAKVTGGGIAFDIAIIGGGEPTCPTASPLSKKLQRNETEDEVALKRKRELAMIEKQEKARERREEIERKRREKMRRQTLHRQTNYKLSVMFHLLDILQ
ncbi:uncharacterized protein LOC133171840 [Saccostrea echinata]|uniref:uncharacterized protein LOC133171840 n=1 Tax=Saccostrea echinata TaxID=191078 RepID=UPI002A7FCE3E|nr:uncharacterized protein LOC133171840 [Saccostrea echinata]